MRILKALLLPLLLIVTLIGLDRAEAAGDLTRRPQSLPDLRLGSAKSDYALSQTEYHCKPARPTRSR